MFTCSLYNVLNNIHCSLFIHVISSWIICKSITGIRHYHFTSLSIRCPLPFLPCRRRLNPKRFFPVASDLFQLKQLLISGGMCRSLLQWWGLIQEWISQELDLPHKTKIHKYHQRTLFKQVTVGCQFWRKLDFMEDCEWPLKERMVAICWDKQSRRPCPVQIVENTIDLHMKCVSIYIHFKWLVWFFEVENIGTSVLMCTKCMLGSRIEQNFTAVF